MNLFLEIPQVAHEIKNHADLIVGPESDDQKSPKILWRSLSPIAFGYVNGNRSGRTSQLRTEFPPFMCGEIGCNLVNLQSQIIAALVDSKILVTGDAFPFLVLHRTSNLSTRTSRISKLRSQT